MFINVILTKKYHINTFLLNKLCFCETPKKKKLCFYAITDKS